ncbi:hypothetical protein ABZ552_15680 [Nocardia sp. NPDC019219]|uniref:hypothetical protein n=1 Tax=Nocardia sp. NPDC019219 TaxID=3154590 RepID=UPI00340F5AC1
MDPQSLSQGYRLRAGRQRHRRVQPERRGAVLTFDEVESTTGRADSVTGSTPVLILPARSPAHDL